MAVRNFETQISADQLLHAVAQLPPAEFEHFLDGAVKLSRKKRVAAQQPSRREANLLLKINQVLPPAMRQRHALRPTRHAEHGRIRRIAAPQ
jgi:hypothetical protein